VAELSVSGVKAALDELGLHGGAPRPPLKPLRDKDRAKVVDALRAAGMLKAQPA
jgi:dihydrodipicolinate synthase/N-acetylneuraminate lyase